jgi:hypothetical protein
VAIVGRYVCLVWEFGLIQAGETQGENFESFLVEIKHIAPSGCVFLVEMHNILCFLNISLY